MTTPKNAGTSNEDLNARIIFVEGKRDHFLATWASVRNVVESEVPESEPEQAFLMAVMSKLADQDKATNKDYKVKLSVREWVGCWNCLNTCILQGDFTKTGIADKTMRLEALSLVAIRIEEAISINLGPLEIIKGDKE